MKAITINFNGDMTNSTNNDDDNYNSGGQTGPQQQMQAQSLISA